MKVAVNLMNTFSMPERFRGTVLFKYLCLQQHILVQTIQQHNEITTEWGYNYSLKIMLLQFAVRTDTVLCCT